MPSEGEVSDLIGGFTTQGLSLALARRAGASRQGALWAQKHAPGRGGLNDGDRELPVELVQGEDFAVQRCHQENPARRPDYAVGEQHAWRAAGGAAGLSAHRPLLCQIARKSGAVGRAAALVSHPERGAPKISARPPVDPAGTPATELIPPAVVANRDANCGCAWSQLPDLRSFDRGVGFP